MEIPPLSKVTPLPTRTTGLSFLPPPLYSSIISFASSALPLDTPSNAPIPSFFIEVSFNASNLRFPSFATSLALSARIEGVISLDGVETRSLAQ